MNPVKVAFVTVCGQATEIEVREEYNYLLGSIRYHATMGIHVVIDTCPQQWAIKPKNLPSTVQWYHEPIYGFGQSNYRLQDATKRGIDIARTARVDVVAILDCDEFYDKLSGTDLFPKATDKILNINTYHWYPDLKGYDHQDYHRRVGPAKEGLHMGRNYAWIEHPNYNGNPQDHCFLSGPWPVVKVEGIYHHHVPKAVGRKHFIRYPGKAIDMPCAAPIRPIPWPDDLAMWRDRGLQPIEKYL